eukprot:jgi/Tetstr1/465934/TSEL_010548.t1
MGEARPSRLPTKAHSEPTQRLHHLGLEIDFEAMGFSAPPEKLKRLATLSHDLLCSRRPPVQGQTEVAAS